MITPASPTAQPAAAPANAKTRPQLVPFVRAAKWARYAAPAQSLALTTAVQTMNFVVPAINGWNRKIMLLVQNVTAGNSANVTFAADGPWNVFTNILLTDAGQKQLINLRGIDAYVMNQYGAYENFKIDDTNAGYVATTSTGSTGGSFTFELTLPQELARDGIGAYPNMDASQRLSLTLTLNVNANIYGTAPTNPGTVTVTPIVYYYTKPPAVNARGRPCETTPPGVGTIQYWRTQTIVLASGSNLIPIQLSGRYLRNIFGVFTDASDVRSDTVKPTTGTIRAELDNNFIYEVPYLDLQYQLFRRFGISNTSPTGFVPLHIGTYDPDGWPGSEWGDSYWETSTASQLVLKFTTGAAGKLYLLTDEIEVPDDTIFRYD